MKSSAIRNFRRLCFSTLVAVYILILAGGVVRSTGSGMGCPDWPTCFGRWIPPTKADQLPSDYKEFYANYRNEKNIRFAKYLSAFGLSKVADEVVNDPAVLEEEDFNAARTWTEYINRLLGAIAGFFIIGLFIRSLKLRTKAPILFWFSLFTLVTVIFQGWFGSIVVSTNLTQWTITVHMFLALLIVGLLIYLYHSSDTDKVVRSGRRWLNIMLIVCLILLLVQVFLGTEVREAIDRISSNIQRNRWVESLGLGFLIHRSFSIIVLIFNVILFVGLMKSRLEKPLSLLLIVLILGAILTGVGMAYMAIPPFLQPVHLLLATLVFGIQLLLVLRLGRTPNGTG